MKSRLVEPQTVDLFLVLLCFVERIQFYWSHYSSLHGSIFGSIDCACCLSIELRLFGSDCHGRERGYTLAGPDPLESEDTRDMYLKSLHIQGFKTFEQSTTLELSYPVIAIVGPNGSGKSNLVDALRWTLCEQNLRTLRARSMLELIFAGSATRHPVNYAEAEVVFNNEGDVFGTGTDKVTVARRIFRSRESDFLIDGNDVQLRDVEG